MVKQSLEWSMKWGALLCLLIFFRRLHGLGTDMYSETSEQMTTSRTATSFLAKASTMKTRAMEVHRQSNAGYRCTSTHKEQDVGVCDIICNQPQRWLHKTWPGNKGNSWYYGPTSPSQDTKDHNAFSLLSKIPDQNYNRRGVTKPSFETSRPR